MNDTEDTDCAAAVNTTMAEAKSRRRHVWDPIDGMYRTFEWREDIEMWVEV